MFIVGSERITYHPLGYERVYLPLCKVADTPFHIQRDDICYIKVFEVYIIIKSKLIIIQCLISLLAD